MDPLAAYARLADRVSAAVGRAAAWLVPGVVAAAFAVVVLRYGFGVGRVWLQELYVWLNAAAVLLAAPWVLARDGHVRIDVAYARGGPRYRAWVDLLGSLLLLAPFCLTLLATGWPYARQSLLLLEGSREAGGLPGVYALKALILAFAGLLLVQGLALAARSLRALLAPGDGAR